MANDGVTLTEEQRQQLFEELYISMFPRVARYVGRRGGTFDEAKDVFQEAVIIYYEKMMGKGVATVASTNAYIMGIARHLWSKLCKEKALKADSDGMADIADNYEKTASEKVLGFLSVAGKKCMDMLHAVYYNKQNMKQVAGQFGFGSERSATVQKYKCLEKVRDIVKQKSLVYEDFLD